jgi:hypothetical protein
MEETIRKSGYSHKKTYIDDHVTEAINHYGSSVIVWSGEDIGASDNDNREPIKHKKQEMEIKTIEDGIKGLTGIFVQDQDGWCLKHGDYTFRRNEKHDGSTRVLPVVTTDELIKDYVETTDNADTSSSRISGTLLASTIENREKYNDAFIRIKQSSEKFFKLQDEYVADLVNDTRLIRDEIQETNKIHKVQITALQNKESELELLYTHASTNSEHTDLLHNIADHMDRMFREMNKLRVIKK